MNKELNKKLFCIDLDGTLLRSNKLFEFSTKNKLIIEKVIEQGHKVAIVTGRSWPLVKPIYERLDLKTPVIINNGATVFDPTKNFPKVEKYVMRSNVFDAIKYLDEKKVLKDFLIFGKEHDYSTQSKNMFNIEYETLPGTKKKVISKEDVSNIEEDIICANIRISNSDESLNAIHELSERFEKTSRFITWGLEDITRENIEIEILSKTTNKFSAIEELSGMLGFKNEDIIAFGDGANDIEMISGVGEGIAMKNAVEKVKLIADHVTPFTNDEDGVALYIEDNYINTVAARAANGIEATYEVGQVYMKPGYLNSVNLTLNVDNMIIKKKNKEVKISFNSIKDISQEMNYDKGRIWISAIDNKSFLMDKERFEKVKEWFSIYVPEIKQRKRVKELKGK